MGSSPGHDAAIEELLSGPVVEVAQRLLGWRIRTDFEEAPTEVILNEVEAYAGADDPASHAYRGRMTPSNRSMFAAPATLYVYRSYGVHWCMNIVVDGDGSAHAVLLRSGVPTVGEEAMERRRGRADHLTDGPGKLSKALGVSGAQDGTSVVDGPVRLLPGDLPDGYEVEATPRIGLTKAVENPWRFVAKKRPSRL